MKKFAAVLVANVVITVIFYLLGIYRVEEFGGLSHIGLAGLTMFIPYISGDVPSNCLLQNTLTSCVAFTPILVIKFDIITLIVILIYSLFLNFTICNKLKRRNLETED